MALFFVQYDSTGVWIALRIPESIYEDFIFFCTDIEDLFELKPIWLAKKLQSLQQAAFPTAVWSDDDVENAQVHLGIFQCLEVVETQALNHGRNLIHALPH